MSKIHLVLIPLAIVSIFFFCSCADENEPETAAPASEVDGDEEEPEESECIAGDFSNRTKCEINRNTPDRDVTAADGGRIFHCEPGNPLDGVGLKIDTMTLLNDVHIKVSQVDDLVVEGWVPVGPAVEIKATTLSAGDSLVLENDAHLAVPFIVDSMTQYCRKFHVNVAFQLDPDTGLTSGEGNPPYFMPKTKSLIKVDCYRQLLYFENLNFGTYQAFIPEEIQEPTIRRFSYRALAGISMGAGAAAINGLKNHEKFDILGPMGGIMDMTYLVNMVRDMQLGGFCSYDEITGADDIDEFVMDMDKECAYCGPQTIPEHWDTPVEKCYMEEPRPEYSYYGSQYESLPEFAQNDEHAQGYNHWYFDDNGGNFNRTDYLQIFRDLTYSYGNAMNYNPESPYLAVGFTGDRLQYYLDNIYYLPQNEGCQLIAEWMQTEDGPIRDFKDGEYNPDGTYPVISYCDGSEKYTIGDVTYTDRRGDWEPIDDPKARSKRVDILLAVDFNENGVRDYGEPVIRQFWEPYEDCGADGVCDENENGYDSVNNSDPAGDNYNPFTNPLGTEGDGLWQENEPYEDIGINGVDEGCTPEDTTNCPYDYGEGNGVFDYNPNIDNSISHDPRTIIHDMDIEDLKRLNIWMDAGIRDLFNFAIMGDHLAGALTGRLAPLGLGTGVYQGFASLQFPRPEEINKFRFLKVNYSQLGQNVFIRYGDYLATNKMIDGGDGRHVGYPPQVIFRIQTFFSFVNTHFPNGNYDPVEAFSTVDLVQNFRFDSDVLGRPQKYSVALPPGYFTNNVEGGDGQPDECIERFPVVYLMHGYGQGVRDLSGALGILFGYMIEGTFQKIITIFPDGECDKYGVCEDDCGYDCRTSPNRPQCIDDCLAERCQNVHNECEQGTFYANHLATYDNPTGVADGNGFKHCQIEDGLLELIDYIDANYCTKPAEEVEVDGATLDGLY